MTIRSTICTLALIAGSVVSGCNSEQSETTTETSQNTSDSTAQAESDGFGIHIGSFEQAEGLAETWDGGPRTVYYKPDPFITGAHIAEFSDSRDGNGNPAIDLRLTGEGAELLEATTAGRIGEPIVLAVDGEVVSAPVVQSTISRRAQVTGGDETEWIEPLKTILADAGAEEVDRVSEPNQEPDILPTVGIYRAGTARTADRNIAFNELEGVELWMAAEPMLTDEHIESAAISSDVSGRPALELTLTDEGAAILEARAGDYVGGYFVFTWEGRAVSVPRVMSELGRKLMITGPVLDPELPENWMDQLLDSFSDN